MALRDKVNAALRRAGGVELVRTGTIRSIEGDLAEARENTRIARANAGRARANAAKARANVAKARESARRAWERSRLNKAEFRELRRYTKRWLWDLPPDYHPDMQWIWPRVADRTRVGHDELNHLCDAVRHVTRTGIPGDVVECGVGRGGTMLGCALTLEELGEHDRHLYLYDTYEGVAETTEPDGRSWRPAGREPTDRVEEQAPLRQRGGLEDVRSAFDEADFPADRLHLVEGKVEDTIPRTVPETISVLRLATDWYGSTRHELEHLYPRLAPGGIVIIADYGGWQGSRDAAEEYFASIDEPVFLVRTGTSRAAVKPAPRTQA